MGSTLETASTLDRISEQAALKLSQFLSPAEQRVCSRLLRGLSEKEVATQLRASEHTIHNHVRAIYRTFDVHSHRALMAYLLKDESP